MKIWVDADACPGAVKEIIIIAACKRSIVAIFVANKQLAIPQSPYLLSVKVDKASDAADVYIKDNAQNCDLVVTQDIPLAHQLVSAGVAVIDPRGKKYNEDNIGDRLSMRNLMQDLRDGGEITGGPKQYGDKEKRSFASTFDKELTRLLKIS